MHCRLGVKRGQPLAGRQSPDNFCQSWNASHLNRETSIKGEHPHCRVQTAQCTLSEHCSGKPSRTIFQPIISFARGSLSERGRCEVLKVLSVSKSHFNKPFSETSPTHITQTIAVKKGQSQRGVFLAALSAQHCLEFRCQGSFFSGHTLWVVLQII